MSQLEAIGRMIKAKRDERISEAAHTAAVTILNDLPEDFDPKEVAQKISDEVGRILEENAARYF